MEIRQVPERPMVAIRETATVAELPELMGRCYGEIAAFLEAKGSAVAGPPFALYYSMDTESFDVEIGFPVESAGDGNKRIRFGTLPAGTAAVEIHRGPYNTLENTYVSMMKEIESMGRQMDTFMYEFYLNDPDVVAPEEIETEIYLPLKNT